MQVGWSHFVVRTGRTLSLAEAGAQPRTGLMVTKFVELVIVLQGVRLANTLIIGFGVFLVCVCVQALPCYNPWLGLGCKVHPFPSPVAQTNHPELRYSFVGGKRGLTPLSIPCRIPDLGLRVFMVVSICFSIPAFPRPRTKPFTLKSRFHVLGAANQLELWQ